MSEWISVKDRLPEKDQAVLFFEKDGRSAISAVYTDDKNKYNRWEENCNCGGIERESNFHQSEITHWMPLPEPPINAVISPT